MALNAEEVVARFVTGESTHTLAKAYGVSRDPIRRILKEHGVQLRDRKTAHVSDHAQASGDASGSNGHPGTRNAADGPYCAHSGHSHRGYGPSSGSGGATAYRP